MKKLLLMLVLLATTFGFAQDINKYKYIILKDKFEFQSKPNLHNLNELTKMGLEKYGFNVFYSNRQFPEDLALDRCKALYADVEESGILYTKIKIVLRDCNDNIVYTSGTGTTRVKERPKAYYDALRGAIASMESLKYKYSGDTQQVSQKPVSKTETATAPVKTPAPEVTVNPSTLFAQPIANGYQLVDSTPKVVLKMYRTSQADSYTALSDKGNGVVFKKGSDWYFEYYQNDKLVSEKLEIKF